MLRCGPRAHVGAIELRQRDRHAAQLQCQACRRPVGRRRPLSSLDSAERRALQFWSIKPRRTRPNAKRRRYNRFLSTAAWKRIRLQVLERDRWRCQGKGCGVSLRPPARAYVHHEEYAEDLASVPLERLKASCNRCNVNEKEQRFWS